MPVPSVSASAFRPKPQTAGWPRHTFYKKDIYPLAKAEFEHLAKEGFDKVFGARPLRRVVGSEIEDRLAELIIRGERREEVEFVLENGEIVLK